MKTYLIRMEFEVIDRQAAELNAQLLDRETTPEMSGGFSCDIQADDASEALAEAFARGLRFQGGNA